MGRSGPTRGLLVTVALFCWLVPATLSAAPTAPSNLTATAASTVQINLSWTASTSTLGIANYVVQRCQGTNCSNYAKIATPAGTTYNDTGLSPSTSYRYRVEAVDTAGTPSSFSSIASATTLAAPKAPGNLAAKAVSAVQINLNWTASTSAIGIANYVVQRCQGTSCTNYVQIAAPTGTTYNDTGLSLGTVYRYRVEAVDTTGTPSSFSSAVKATTLTPTPPTTPGSLKATAVSTVQINLSWAASTSAVGIANYVVQRCQGTSCSNFAQIAAPTGTTYNDTGLLSGTGYRYRVEAVDTAGIQSSFSSAVSASTLTPTPPTTPGSLKATAVSAVQINLSWTASTSAVGIANYVVQRCQGTSCSNFAQIAALTGTTYNDTGLSPGTSYRYRVEAVDTAGTPSSFSSIASAATPAAPTAPGNLTATAGGTSQINLTWAASTSPIGLTNYLVQRCLGVGCSSFLQIATPTGTTFNDTGLLPSTSYSYLVEAIDTAGTLSPLSSVASATTQSPSSGNSSAFPLATSTNNRYLVDQNDLPTLLVGDAPHTLFTNISVVDANTYMADRAAHGINTLWCELLVNDAIGGRPDGSTYDGILPFTSTLAGGYYDLTKPNPNYFARVDQVINIAASYGIMIQLDSLENTGWMSMFEANGDTAAYTWGQYLGNRYKTFQNIMWITGNNFQTWNTLSTDNAIAQNIMDGIASADPNHLQTTGLSYGLSGSLDDPLLLSDINLASANTYYPSYYEVLQEYNSAAKTVPVFLGQTYYDGATYGNLTPTTASNLMLRKSEYWTVLAGGVGGYMYGTKYSNFQAGWQSGIDTVAVTQLGYWKSIMTSVLWYNLVPDQSHVIVTAGYGTATGNGSGNIQTDDYVTTASTPDGSLIVSYLPVSTTITVDMTKLQSSATARWYDPTNGTYTAIRGAPFSNIGTQVFTTPPSNSDGDPDWVLILESHPPTAPSGLTAAAAGSNQINLSWVASTSVVGLGNYVVERCQGAGCSTFAQIATPTGITYNDSGLSPNASYSYRVKAVDLAGTPSIYSNVATTFTQSDAQPPTAPGALTATAAGISQINLNWTASTDNVGVTGYSVERCQGAACTSFAQIATLNGTITAYNDAGLAASTSYSYRVRATDAAGNFSTFSSTAATSTLSDTQPPTAPGALTATAVGVSQINLNWTASTDNVGVTGYSVERCQGAACTNFAQITTLNGTTTTYNDTGLAFSTGYSYRVRATDAAGNFSIFSNVATTSVLSDTQPPTAPSNLTATTLGSNSSNGTPGTFTLIQHVNKQPCAAGTTCAITLPQSVGAGHLLIFSASSAGTGGVYMSRIDKGGTLVQCVSCQGSDLTNGGRPQGYVLNSSSATSPITITWSASTTANVEMWEFSYAGTPQFDGGTAITYPSGTVPVGPSFNLSGGNDVIAQSCATANSCTAVTPPYSANADFSSGNGWAASINTNSGTGPTWNVSSPGVTGLGAIAFGFNTASCANESFVDFEGGTANASATEANLRRSTNGWKGGVWSIEGSGAAMKFQAAASKPLLGPTGRLCGDGGTYASGAGSVGLQYLTSSGVSYVKYSTGPLISDSVSAGVWFFSDLPDADQSNLDVFTIFGAKGADFANAKFLAGGSVQNPTRIFQLEVPNGAQAPPDIPVKASTWYWLNLQYNKSGNHILSVYDALGNLVGTITGPASGTTKPDFICIGNSSHPPTSGFVVNFDSLKVSLEGTYPLLPWAPQINLSWTASTDNVGVTGYLVERCQGTGCSNFAQIAALTDTTFSDSGLTPSTSYTYRVRATDAAANLSTYSNIASAGTSDDSTPPTAPSNLTATPANSTQINLSWTASIDNVGVTGYLVERCQGVGCNNFAQIATPLGTMFNDIGLIASTSYSYRVRATDAATNLSAYSDAASAGTLAPDTTAPSAPANLTATPANSAQINLSWAASTDDVGVTGYLVERCTGAGCSNFAQIGTSASTTFNDTGLTASTSYSYRVRATDAAANLSIYSNTASAGTPADTTPPTTPATLKATPANSTQINLSWAASTDNTGVTGYLVERCQGSGCSNFAQIATPGDTTFNDTGLAASTSYSYRVRATDAAANLSTYSNTASATTPAPTIGSITFVQVNAATPQSALTSVPVIYPAAQSAGDLNVVVVGWNDTTHVVNSVTDTKGNIYTLAAGPTVNAGGGLTLSTYYAKNIAAAAAGANTVTVAFNGAAAYADIRILEYKGADLTAPVDVISAGAGNGTANSTAAVTTTHANDLLFAANIVTTMTTSAGTGFTKRIITTPDADIAEDRPVTATSSYIATASISSGAWVMQMVAFKVSGAP